MTLLGPPVAVRCVPSSNVKIVTSSAATPTTISQKSKLCPVIREPPLNIVQEIAAHRIPPLANRSSSFTEQPAFADHQSATFRAAAGHLRGPAANQPPRNNTPKPYPHWTPMHEPKPYKCLICGAEVPDLPRC